jgi:hypothetical protein
MAEPQPNYLTGVNQARQPGRSARRKRAEDMLSPLESAAAMDRLQGVDVGDFSGVVDSPSTNIIPVIFGTRRGGGGGYSSPPPQYFDGPQESYSAPSPCKTGRCGIQASAPMAAPTTVYSTPSTSTVSQPAAATTTTPAKPAAPKTPQERFDEARATADAHMERAIETGRSNPTDAGLRSTYAGQKYLNAQQDREHERWEKEFEVNKTTALAAAENARTGVEAEAAQRYGDAHASHATARLAEEASGEKYAEVEDRLLASVIEQGRSPTQFADAMAKLRANSMSEVNAGKDGTIFRLQATNEQKAKDQRDSDLRRAFAGHAIYLAKQSTMYYEAQTASPGESVNIARTAGMVGKDPRTGEPVEFSQDQPYGQFSPKRMNAMLGPSVDAIVKGYASTGMLTKDWSEVTASIENDVAVPMRRTFAEDFMKSNAARIDSLPEEYREIERRNVAERATILANNFVGYIQSEIALQRANSMAGPSAAAVRQAPADSKPDAPSKFPNLPAFKQ